MPDRACWERNLNIADEKVLASTLSAAGFDVPSLLARASTQQIKDILRANTQQAQDLGICGVPSYRVSHKTADGWRINGGIIWGQDETNVVKDLISGWDEDRDQVLATVGPEHENFGSKL